MGKMKFDFDGLIQLLAGHLYSEKQVFIRELIQNGHDAILRRREVEGEAFLGKISIETRPDDLFFSVQDSGIGMNKADLEEFLSTIGRGITRQEKQSGAVEGLIGQFGIGFLSAFVVADRVEVFTRRLGEVDGWVWRNSGNEDYTIERHQVEQTGTSVIVHLKGVEEKGVVHFEEVRKVIRKYADLLTIPIHLNGSGNPINTRQMPWEQAGKSTAEVQFDTRIYLEKSMRDSVLELIPINLPKLRTSGALYITRARAVQVEIPRTLRLYVNRMFVCDKETDLLPKWAGFVNGVISTSDQTLRLTAARDNFIRDDEGKYITLQKALGDVIIHHLDDLSQNDPQRFSDVLRYHNLSFKAACYYYNEFFEKFSHLIEWRTNKGSPTTYAGNFTHEWRTLRQVMEQVAQDNGIYRIPYFTDSNATNQYFQMADAAGSLVVDASHWFEGALLKEYAKKHTDQVQLLAVDRVDDPAVFQQLQQGTDSDIRKLCEYMSQAVKPGVTGSIRVEARYFEPKELSALIRSGETGTGEMKAREILDDPQMPQDMREMAEEMLLLARNSSRRLVLNANSNIVRRLAKQDYSDSEIVNLMRGIYNSAILYNQELMTPQNARIFYEDFQRFLQRNLDHLEEKAHLRKQAEELAKERAQLTQPKRGLASVKHVIFFLMTPFSDDYGDFRRALREVIENRFGCQLFIASDRQYKDTLAENVFHHMDQAHAFIAEVTDSNPNVMFELGAARYELRARPIVLMIKERESPLPVDLQGYIYTKYGSRKGDELVEHLEGQLRDDERIRPLLERAEREWYVSPAFLRKVSRFGNLLSRQDFDALSEKYPTMESWQKSRKDTVRKILGDNSDIADVLVKRIKEGLKNI